MTNSPTKSLSQVYQEGLEAGYAQAIADDAAFIRNRAGYSGDMKMYDLADAINCRVNPYQGKL